MIYLYKSHQITDILKAKKVIRNERELRFKDYGERGKTMMVDVDLGKGPLLDLRLRVAARTV